MNKNKKNVEHYKKKAVFYLWGGVGVQGGGGGGVGAGVRVFCSGLLRFIYFV